MSQYDIIRDCRVDGLYTVDAGQSRHYIRLVVTMREPRASKKDANQDDDNEDVGGGGDDDDGYDNDDEAEEELLDDDAAEGGGDGKAKKKRKRAVRTPKERGIVNARARLPLIHAGAELRLVLRTTLPAHDAPPESEGG